MWWHPGSKCYEEMSVGDKYTTPSRTVFDSDVQTFTNLSGDYHPLYTDEVFARQSVFGGRICPELLSLSMLTGLFMGRLGLFDTTGLAFLALENLSFLQPVRVGDTIRATLEVVGMRESKSKPDFGVVVFKIEGLNQRSERFLECEWHEWVTRLSWKQKQLVNG